MGKGHSFGGGGGLGQFRAGRSPVRGGTRQERRGAVQVVRPCGGLPCPSVTPFLQLHPVTGRWEAPLAPAVHPKNNPLINFLALISSQSPPLRQVLLHRAQGPAHSRLNKEWTVRVPALSDDRGQGILVR